MTVVFFGSCLSTLYDCLKLTGLAQRLRIVHKESRLKPIPPRFRTLKNKVDSTALIYRIELEARLSHSSAKV